MLKLNNPNQIQLYLFQGSPVEAFQYVPPLTSFQRLWLGNYYLLKREDGRIKIILDLREEEIKIETVSYGDYIVRYNDGRLSVVPSEEFLKLSNNIKPCL